MEQPPRQHHGNILRTPTWLLAIRIAQALLSVIVLCLAASVAHDAYLDELGFAIATSLITALIVAYAVMTEKVAACQPAYHVVAVLALDALLVVLWLATFAAAAARRAQFVFDVAVGSCYSNGDLFSSKSCVAKRAVILFKRGGDMMSAAGGIGALVWILFIVSFVWTLVHFLRGHKQGRFALSTGSGAAADTTRTELKAEQSQVNGHFQDPAPAQSPYQQQSPYSPSLPTGAYASAEGQQQPHLHGQWAPPQRHVQPQPMGGELPAQYPTQMQ